MGPQVRGQLVTTEDILEATEAMVVVMEERATDAQVENVVKRLIEMGMDVHRSTGVTRTVLGAVGQGQPDKGLIEMLEGVAERLRRVVPEMAKHRDELRDAADKFNARANR